MGNGHECIPTDEEFDADCRAADEAGQEHEEFCIRAAMTIASDVERGGLKEVNSKLEQHGYKVIRLSDLVPV